MTAKVTHNKGMKAAIAVIIAASLWFIMFSR